VIVKGARIRFKSSSSGINSLLQTIEDLKDKLYKFSVADTVVGRAATLLLVYSHVNKVYAANYRLLREGRLKFEALHSLL